MTEAFRKQQFKKMMLQTGSLKWDPNIIGLVTDEYQDDVKEQMEDQHVDIVFAEKHKSEKQKQEEEMEKKKKLAEQKLKKEEADRKKKEKTEQKQKQEQKKKLLAQIQKEKQETIQKLNDIKQRKEKRIKQQVSEMKSEWHKFCQTLDLDYYETAQRKWAQLDNEGAKPELLKANTKELYEKGFEFASVAKNDDAVSFLQPLEIAQSNFNQNPNNEVLLSRFISAA